MNTRIPTQNDRQTILSFPECGPEAERYWLWLCSCPKMYPYIITPLLRYFGTPKEICRAPVRELLQWKKLTDDGSTAWVDALVGYRETTSVPEAEALLQARGIRFVSRYNPEFPQKLRDLIDCPYGLFFRGSLPDSRTGAIAIVGARRCSNYGQQMAAAISKALTQEGYQIISGMALGVDGTAQAGCLSAGGRSFAVLGCGVDVCYPKEHHALYRSLQKDGGVISEYPPGTAPLKGHFPNRNRLISGLSDSVVVIEARSQSGSLITADLALDQGKDVYAVPGRYNDPLSYGCNRLIEQGAGIVLSTESLLENLSLTLGKARPSPGRGRKSVPLPAGMKAEEQRVYEELDFDARSIDEIAAASGLTLLQTMTALIGLQLKHCAVEVSKNCFALALVS